LTTFVGSNFLLMKDIIVGAFEIEIMRINTGVKNSFDRLGNFVKNIGDNLYIMLSENLQFSFPKIAVPLPGFLGGGEFTLIDAFTAGVGDESTRAAARTRINTNNANSAGRITARNNELASLMDAQQDRINQLNNAFQNQVVNAVNDARVTNNVDTTVMNAPTMPSTVEASGPF
jgi:hypothetical protein